MDSFKQKIDLQITTKISEDDKAKILTKEEYDTMASQLEVLLQQAQAEDAKKKMEIQAEKARLKLQREQELKRQAEVARQ